MAIPIKAGSTKQTYIACNTFPVINCYNPSLCYNALAIFCYIVGLKNGQKKRENAQLLVQLDQY